jgi:hypothetical protein
MNTPKLDLEKKQYESEKLEGSTMFPLEFLCIEENKRQAIRGQSAISKQH